MAFEKIITALQTARDFGFRWALRRSFYEFKLRTGYHKRKLPKRGWRKNELGYWLKEGLDEEKALETWLDSAARFFFSSKDKDQIGAAIRELNKEQPEALEALKNVDIRRPRYFSKLDYEVQFPKVWFTNPFLSPPAQVVPDKHWSEYPMYSKAYEDLKFVWEYGRFSIVYDLARAYFITNDERYSRQYWYLIESWIDNNPPNTGPHWKCGQETSLRLMAWYFGLFAFLDSPETTSERFSKFLGAVAAQVSRITKDLEYSFLQHSNHAVSEGLGLYVTGLLFPQLQGAEKWKKIGKENLIKSAYYLIRPDGTYLQKSHNYLRFVLHAYLYVLALAKANDEVFPDRFKERLKVALTYLKSVFDEKSGRVPNFGSNDGALILPLNSCDFTDYRPVIGAWHFYFFREKLFENGQWNEDLVWLFGASALDNANFPILKKAIAQQSESFEVGGIYTLRGRYSWAFLHAESYKDRPAQADALHVDLWWKGLNICIDPGTYLYYGHQPWLDAFKHTRFHNTVTVDGKDQMERFHRFTWGYWHNCQLNGRWANSTVRAIELEHDGFKRLTDPVIHRRAVALVGEGCWIVIDDLIGKDQHELQLHWLLHDFPFTKKESGLQLSTPEGDLEISVYQYAAEQAGRSKLKIVRGDPQKDIIGLKSNYYGVIEPAISLNYTFEGQLPTRVISFFAEKDWRISVEETQNLIKMKAPERNIILSLNDVGEKIIIQPQ